MMNYNNNDVVQCLRQYEMFANSLKLVRDNEQREMIIKQLTKLEQKIIDLTNEVYEEEYYALANKKCSLIDEEKRRITMLIDLINQRLSYIEKRCNDHYELTGRSINVKTVLGSLELDNLENNIRIINKYIKNVKLESELKDEVKSLANKIDLASEKIEINKSLNIELEDVFKKTLTSAFEKLNLYDLLDIESDIEQAYYETEKSLTLAELNLETAKTSPINILSDCQAMYDDISKDYNNFKDKMMTIRLIKTFNSDVYDYDELLNKRKDINEIVKYIKNKDLLDMIMDTISKQYNTILMEGQDVNTYNDLVLEKERKLDAIEEINNENNSEEFQSILKVLIENEKKRQEKIQEEQRRIQEEEKKKKLELERKRQEEILKRQRIIEEARKKEMEKRTKKMLEEQQNSILQNKKKSVSFETIKDSSIENEKINNNIEEKNNFLEEVNKKFNLNLDDVNNNNNRNGEELATRNNLEKELFDEFNNGDNNNNNNNNLNNDNFFNINNNVFDDKKVDNEIPEIDRNVLENKNEEKVNVNTQTDNTTFPSMSIDDYMRNFDEDKISDVDNMFDSDMFPSIPM